MAYKEYKSGNTRYAYDPYSGEGIAFADPTQRSQIFGNTPMGDVADLPVDATLFNQTPGKAVKGQQDLSGIAKEAGASGMAFADLQKMIGSSVTPDETNKIRSGLGIDSLENSVFQLAPSTEQLYQQAYSGAGLSDIKAQIKAVTDEYNKKKQELEARMATVNENPWKTEASRLGSVAREKEFYDGTLGNLQAQIGQLTDLYNTGVNEVNNVVGRQTTDFSNNQSINQAKLNYLLGKAENQQNQLQTSKDQLLARYFPDYTSGLSAQQDKNLVLNLASQYPDAGITSADSMATAQAKLQSSRIYREQVRPPQDSSQAAATGLAGTNVIDQSTDTDVAKIIASRPGDGGYGDAYKAVAAKHGTAVANLYDTVFQDVFNKGVTPTAALNNLKVTQSQPKPSTYQSDTNNRIFTSVAELLPDVNNYTVGASGKLLYQVPNTPAYDFNAKLETLKSNISFGALTQMREASKTGGALGNVSDREGKLLESSLAALDIGQSPTQFKEQLRKIQQSIAIWNITAQTGAEPKGVVVKDDGSVWQQNQDGSYTRVQ